ncbi:phosphatase PAP2 family protein [Caulobacter endophyticus]|uniref:phosphatase PAP2 family protein n=1 Tax=Caulobacter endophyticus TaxID=2172652 RepID=UPI00241024E8|nr:phosphatase PAP2 family protein [Caulobacter endophyticus]MDG2531567.1 phosphatase PAP2 family protein [Caulobacter endophyticus]
MTELGIILRTSRTLTLTAAGGACAFAATAAFAVTGNATLPDLWVLEHLRASRTTDRPIGPDELISMASLASAAASPFVSGPVAALLALALKIRGRRRDAVLVSAAGAGSVVLGLFLKSMFTRERPEAAWRLAEAHGPGFPSTQTLFATALALSLAIVVFRTAARPRDRAIALGLALIAAGLVGASRIYLGVHWTSDVLAAWSAGAAWAGLCGLATTARRT